MSDRDTNKNNNGNGKTGKAPSKPELIRLNMRMPIQNLPGVGQEKMDELNELNGRFTEIIECGNPMPPKAEEDENTFADALMGFGILALFFCL
ncbi:uncharacterized protein FIESC28_00725 [Fusarium coffeatum]|uniref:Uncharacterized protein n=1 Tax=Fusarium coffeatum TaxID=231269 RepID=A0A366SAS2_9HYPO|nr:uncharacterized protein FIESC28_00725 [Fusarium coffeatum]RBR26431.1 hypothetical protein FIESC28_00725 [Fusarium coffeatum]